MKPSERKKITSVALPPAALDEIAATIKPASLSKHITQVVVSDLDRRRRDRYDRVQSVTQGVGVVYIDVPLDDVPLWSYDGWLSKQLDDIEAQAVLYYECDTPDQLADVYERVAAVVEGRDQ